MIIRTLMILPIFVSLLFSRANADQFVLRNGEEIEGKIIAQSGAKYLIATDEKQLWIDIYQIKKIIKDPVVKKRPPDPNADKAS